VRAQVSAQECAQPCGQVPGMKPAGGRKPPRRPPDYRPITYRGVVIAVSDVASEHPFIPRTPDTDARTLLAILMRELGGEPATRRAIVERYCRLCWESGVPPFPWQMVALPFNARLKSIHGDRVYEGWTSVPDIRIGVARKVPARTVLVPTLAEAEAAEASRQNPDVIALHQRG